MALGSKEHTSLKFINVAQGKLHLFNGKGQAPTPYDTIDGQLKSITLRDDQAPGYDPYLAVVIELVDGDDTYQVKGNATSTFAWMFASHLPAIEKGEHVQISVSPASENKKVTCCWVRRKEGDNWERIERAQYPDGKAAKVALAHKHIAGHPAYVASSDDSHAGPEPSTDGSPQTQPNITESPEEQRFWNVIAAMDLPPYRAAEQLYLDLLRKGMRDPNLRSRAELAPSDWKRLADRLDQVKGDISQWPPLLRDYYNTNQAYDPFTDS